MENGCSLSKIFSNPPPTKVNTNEPGVIPTKVVPTNVLKETLKKAGARLTIQKGNRGTKRKNKR